MKLQSGDFDFFTETMEFDRFVLVPNRLAAEAFFDTIFPHIANCMLVSADGSFPQNSLIREKCLKALEENRDVRAVVFNPETLNGIRVVTERVLLMDDYLIQDVSWAPEERELGFQLVPEKVAYFINSYFRQWDKLAGKGNFSFLYRNLNRLNWSESEWKLRILVGDFDPISLENKNPYR